MQLSCPGCSRRLVLDDARVPERSTIVKCPQCGGPVRVPGRIDLGVAATPSASVRPAALEAPEPIAARRAALGAPSRHAPEPPGWPAAGQGHRAAFPPAVAPEAPPTSSVAPPAHPEDAGAAARMEALLRAMVDRRASDLHLSTGTPPMIRRDGEMEPLGEGPELTAAEALRLVVSIAPPRNREEYERRHDTDFGYEIAGLGRFRCNLFVDRKGPGGVFRAIPSRIMTAEEMGLAPELLELCQLPKGLVLVTGPTGSGKSTTLCALVDHVNRTRSDHIITIEDPLEFVHENKKCLVNQREVGGHTSSFKEALRAALREDPDVVLVGEMRDLETVAIAIETAETGHLVFGTLHTSSAASTVDRIVNQFPADRQQQIRIMLAESLRGVISQVLCRRIGGGRVAAFEVLIGTPPVCNLVREAKTFQIPSIMQAGRRHGMCTLNDSLLDLVRNKVVAPEEAYARTADKAGLLSMFRRSGIDVAWAPKEAAAPAAAGATA